MRGREGGRRKGSEGVWEGAKQRGERIRAPARLARAAHVRPLSVRVRCLCARVGGPVPRTRLRRIEAVRVCPRWRVPCVGYMRVVRLLHLCYVCVCVCVCFRATSASMYVCCMRIICMCYVYAYACYMC